MCEMRAEEASNLIDELGIPQSEKEVKEILENGDTSIDSCLLTYATMLCEQTPEGNEHVDTLITTIMQNCKPEHIDRIVSDFGTYRKTINDRTESQYNPSHEGINWKTFAGNKVSNEPVPINLRRRERLLTKIFEGMVRNPNINIESLLSIMGSHKGVTQKFSDAQFEVLQEALSSGECAFTREELMNASELFRAEKHKELTEKIPPEVAVRNALNEGITPGDVNRAASEEKQELYTDKGVTKDD